VAPNRGGAKRVADRWNTEFGRWVSDVGVSQIVNALAHDPDLKVTNGAVYKWLWGHAPQPRRAMALVAMSEGRLTLESIYQHASQVWKQDDS
jgi:hypothetical protein